MDRLKDILVVIDPTAKQHPALDKAAQIAAAANASLTLLCCDHDPALVAKLLLSPRALSAARGGFLRKQRKLLEKLATPLRQRGLGVETAAIWDSPLAAGILREVGLRHPGLVVKDTNWHAPLRRGLFTNTDWQLIKDCPVPLLLAKPSPWPGKPVIAAAVDPGHPGDPAGTLDRRIVAAAGQFAQWLGGSAELVHAYPDPVTQGSGRLPLGAVAAQIRQAAETAVAGLLEGRDGPPLPVRLLPGSPVDVIPRHCVAGTVDLLVTGAIARSRVYEVLIGGTAERLLDRIASDLVVVRRPQPG